ncbi:elicitor-responsive protein 3 [Artemisia annua]|uniref:Elicitor-responsive protein 3 n=1 Tax=Artemisia annua TaxID=35608 RepID=A0A2U1KS04_ARTAN|nr:elicitor-responsive protein 3 [Artemisia annua]
MFTQPSVSSFTAAYHPMENHDIHANLLEVTVVGCKKLKDTEWISRQDPYVCVEYGSNRSRTRVCTDGDKNPIFQERFVFRLMEGLRELNIDVWNSNTLSRDDFIGSGRVQLAKVLSCGYDDGSWPLQTKTGRYAGEVQLIMHYANVNKPTNSYAPSAAPYSSMYHAPPPASVAQYVPASAGAYSAPSPYSYAPTSYTYPPSPYRPPNAGVYPPAPYPPQVASYPPQPYGSYKPHGSSHPGRRIIQALFEGFLENNF